MAASWLGRLFYSDASSHDRDAITHFHHGDHHHGDHVNVPSNSPVTQMHTPSRSRSSSPSLGHMVSPEHVTSSSAIPIDADFHRSIEPNPNARQAPVSQVLQLSTTSKGKHYIPTPSQNIHHHHFPTPHFHPTLVLQNKGSVARDHLASERTFLAYVRTSLGMASAGVALVQLFTMADLVSKSTGVPLPAVNQKMQRFATPLGLSAVGMSIIVLLIGEAHIQVYVYFSS